MRGKDLIAATLFGGAGGSSGGGGGIPQADIDAALAALAEKGVTVPDGATSADLDDLIASIVTGEKGVTYVVEDVVPAEDGNMTNSGSAVYASHVLDADNPPTAIVAYSVFDSSIAANAESGYLVNIAKFVKTTEGFAGMAPTVTYSYLSWMYNSGTKSHYAPAVGSYTSSANKGIRYAPNANSMIRAGVTYRVLLLWGVNL